MARNDDIRDVLHHINHLLRMDTAMEVHKGPYDYRCPHCGAFLMSKEEYQEVQEKNFCSICGQRLLWPAIEMVKGRAR